MIVIKLDVVLICTIELYRHLLVGRMFTATHTTTLAQRAN